MMYNVAIWHRHRHSRLTGNDTSIAALDRSIIVGLLQVQGVWCDCCLNHMP